MGGQIDVCFIKIVLQSYLMQLWNDEVFVKDYVLGSSQLLICIGKYFMFIVLFIGFSILVYWWLIDY